MWKFILSTTLLIFFIAPTVNAVQVSLGDTSSLSELQRNAVSQGLAPYIMFTEDFRLNINVDFQSIATEGRLAHAVSTPSGGASYPEVRRALVANNPDVARLLPDLPALPVYVSGQLQYHSWIRITFANSKALGLSEEDPSIIDGTLTFNTNVDFAYGHQSEPEKTHLPSVAAHELGHILGFKSAVNDPSSTTPYLFDLFRYSDESLAMAKSMGLGAIPDLSLDNRDKYSFYWGGLGQIIEACLEPSKLTCDKIALAKGETTVDMQQASHWGDNQFFTLTSKAGPVRRPLLMDPTIADNEVLSPLAADVFMLGLLGWDLSDSIILTSLGGGSATTNANDPICLEFTGSLCTKTRIPSSPLEINWVGGWRETFYGSRVANGTDFLILAANVTPSPRSNPTLGPDTQVTFDQPYLTGPIELHYQDSPALPNNYATAIPYNINLTNSWQVEASNPGTENTFATAITYAIGNQASIEPVTDMRISGDVNAGLTLSWVNPPVSDSTGIGIAKIQADGSYLLVHSSRQPAGTSSYTIPEELSPGVTLQPGQVYEVSIRNVDEGSSAGEILARASSSFEFTATAQAIDAFLPTVDTAGVYHFDNSVVSGEEINIDPAVAIGYDYAIGDEDNDPWFASVTLPSIGDNYYDLFLYSVAGDTVATIRGISAGEAFDFTAIAGFENGIARFGIRGIEEAVLLDPTDPVAFVTTVTFTDEGRFTGTMTPVTAEVLAPVPVSIEIQPGETEGCFNINGHGVLPVAILGSKGFDVSLIDQQTLRFNWLNVKTKGDAMPQCSASDVNADSYMDLICKFEDNLSAWQGVEGKGWLTGKLIGGALIEGSDDICLVSDSKSKKSKQHL